MVLCAPVLPPPALKMLWNPQHLWLLLSLEPPGAVVATPQVTVGEPALTPPAAPLLAPFG